MHTTYSFIVDVGKYSACQEWVVSHYLGKLNPVLCVLKSDQWKVRSTALGDLCPSTSPTSNPRPTGLRCGWAGLKISAFGSWSKGEVLSQHWFQSLTLIHPMWTTNQPNSTHIGDKLDSHDLIINVRSSFTFPRQHGLNVSVVQTRSADR